MSSVLRLMLLTAGTVCVAVALIGLMVPLLPTTPLLLLAGACYARSSQRCHQWLLQHRWLGGFLRSYHQDRGLTRRQKATALAVLWLAIGVSMTLAEVPWWVRLVVVAIAASVTVYLLRLKTLR